MDSREAVAKAWVGLLYIGYVFLRVVMRILLGRKRRAWVQNILGLDYAKVKAYAVKYGGIYGWEPHVRRIVKKVLNKGRTFIDVGAFTGLYTFYAYQVLRKNAGFKIIAVEPFPNNYRILENKINNENIHLVKQAVWTIDDAIVEFYVEGFSSLDNTSMFGRVSSTKRHALLGGYRGETLRVRTVRLDTLVKRFRLECVDLVKMDVEGAEYEILTDPTLDLSKVQNIIVEIHYRYGSRESEEILRALARLGFKIVPLYPDPKSNSYHLLACRSEIPR
jgi:FkbM family methyltransferase